MTQYKARCMTSKSNNLFLCPKEILKTLGKDPISYKKIKWQNKMFGQHKCCKAKKKSRQKKKKQI